MGVTRFLRFGSHKSTAARDDDARRDDLARPYRGVLDGLTPDDVARIRARREPAHFGTGTPNSADEDE